jgi:hypothetical protein
MLPCQSQISRAVTEGWLQVVGFIPLLKMQVSPILILILQEIMVVCILNYALRLGGFFLRKLRTQLLFDRPELMIWISWESSHGRPYSH